MKKLSDFLSQMPGYVGTVARALNDSFEYSQPGLAIPAALSLGATLKCGAHLSPTGVRPNLYTMIVAGSGAGKSIALASVRDIILQTKLRDLIGGVPVSDAALRKSIIHRPRQVIVWEEFGQALRDFTTTHAHYKVGLMSTLTDLWSRAGQFIKGHEYATEDSIDLDRGYLNIVGASTHGRFFGSLTDDFIEDGFLSRWLTFFVDAAPESSAQTISPLHFPTLQQFVDELNLREQKTGGDLAGVYSEEKVLKLESETSFRLVQKQFRYEMTHAKTPVAQVFWTRAFELHSKLCIILTDYDTLPIETHHYAAELVGFLVQGMIVRCEERIGENDRSKAREKFLNLIPCKEQISKANLTRNACRMRGLRLTKRDREEILADAIEAGDVIEEIKPFDDSQRKSHFYQRLV